MKTASLSLEGRSMNSLYFRVWEGGLVGKRGWLLLLALLVILQII